MAIAKYTYYNMFRADKIRTEQIDPEFHRLILQLSECRHPIQPNINLLTKQQS